MQILESGFEPLLRPPVLGSYLMHSKAVVIAYGYHIHRLNPQVFHSDHSIKAVSSKLYTIPTRLASLYNKFLEAWYC